MTPAKSLPCPEGKVAGHFSAILPSRIAASPGLIPAARIFTRTWRALGMGTGTSERCNTFTPPYSSNRTARYFFIEAIRELFQQRTQSKGQRTEAAKKRSPDENPGRC